MKMQYAAALLRAGESASYLFFELLDNADDFIKSLSEFQTLKQAADSVVFFDTPLSKYEPALQTIEPLMLQYEERAKAQPKFAKEYSKYVAYVRTRRDEVLKRFGSHTALRDLAFDAAMALQALFDDDGDDEGKEGTDQLWNHYDEIYDFLYGEIVTVEDGEKLVKAFDESFQLFKTTVTADWPEAYAEELARTLSYLDKFEIAMRVELSI